MEFEGTVLERIRSKYHQELNNLCQKDAVIDQYTKVHKLLMSIKLIGDLLEGEEKGR